MLWDPQSTHYGIAAPALCVLMALAIVEIGSLLRQIVALPLPAYVGTMTIMVLAIMVGNIYFYFAVYTPRNDYAQTQATTEIANCLRPQARERYVYMFTSPYFYLHFGTISFAAEEPAGQDVIDRLTSSTTLPDPPSGLQPLFIFVPERIDELDIVKQRYPDGQLQEYRVQPKGDRTLMYIYEPRS